MDAPLPPDYFGAVPRVSRQHGVFHPGAQHQQVEADVYKRQVQKIYQPYFAEPRPENMPILGDLMEALLAQGIPEADRVAQARITLKPKLVRNVNQKG